MPASRPALYTRLSAKATTAAIIRTDGPVLRTNSRNLQSAVILVSNADIGTKPKVEHATGQMKMGALPRLYSIAARTWSSGSVAKVVA